MPALVTFDPGTEFFDDCSRKNDSRYFEALNELHFLDPKKFSASLFSLQPQQQLLTPPSSPVPIAYSPFDDVPFEILDQILGFVHSDTNQGIYNALRDISECCLVSRQFYAVAVNWLYRHVPISDPYAFTKVITSILVG